ncbi:hypothetical protein BD410DRAFT_710718 [Rickenella mellea]|uniref:Golgi apparatus membrane protein TVP38 n=1 Tax=Rickenella mellea TaxID=50990 RepID=A0A4R5XFD6_9AGAM|nr:hypothetical protein BD410DRAFT_710718 [Rickenella mellea]
MINEKQGFHDHTAHPAHPDGRAPRPPRPRSHPRLQSHQRPPSHRGPLPLLHSVPMTSRSHPLSTPTRSFRRTVLCQRLKPWLPFILYAMTSLGFVLAISLWKTEVFQALDELSHWLRAEEYTGYGILFFLIFVTTFPPMPLYSTFTILSGYTYGPWTGAVISYFAALSGAITVFVLSRTYFRQWINRCLSHTVTMKRVVRAIEKRPKLLFLVRLAPYPYNMMNALLAGSPTLTFRTYTVCTALSLFKLIIHTSIGSGIHSFANYHTVPAGKEGRDADEDWLNQAFTIGGIALCVAIAGYLSCVARRAVDDELEDDLSPHDSEERVAFLASDPEILGEEMVETQAGGGVPPPHTRFEFSGREEAMVGLY